MITDDCYTWYSPCANRKSASQCARKVVLNTQDNVTICKSPLTVTAYRAFPKLRNSLLNSL